MSALRRNTSSFFLFILVLSFLELGYAGTFKNPGLIDTAYDPIGVTSSDLNHDGNPDLIYVDSQSSPTLHVLLGKGNGTFSDAEDMTLPTSACGYLTCVINLADVNKDGITDIVLGGSASTNQITVMLGKGDGTFQAPIFSSVTNTGGQTPSLNSQIGIGDINGDGAADLVVADYASARFYVLLGNNTGKFTLTSALTIYFTGHTSSYLIDLNGDGHLDAVVSDPVAGQSYVFLGNGDGTFQSQVVYQSFATLLADMDNDGHPDLIEDNYPGQVEILKGNPDGTFAAPTVVTSVPATYFLIATGDYNGDGLRDLVFLTPAGIGVALATGNLTYVTAVSSLAGNDSSVFAATGDITSADLNKDGHNDLVLGGDGGIVLLLGNGDGTFVSGDLYDVGHQVGTVAIADFNGDKSPDIAVTVAASYPRLLLGNGKGAFSLAADQNQTYLTQGQSTTMFAGDFNGDGKQDLDVAQMNSSYPWGQTFVLFGGANGVFSTPLGLSIGATLVADINNDGRSDVVALGPSGDIVTMLGQANGGFISVSTPPHDPIGLVLAIGDVNRDGKQDLITSGFSTLETWLGNGDGTFKYTNAFTPPQGINGAAIADLDGDGNPDLILGPYMDVYNPLLALSIYYGNGDGTFQPPVMVPLSHLYTMLVVSDVNRDNKADLVLSDGIGIAVILNMGSRIFDQEQHYVGGESITGIAVGDVNGDGFPDIVAADGAGTTVAVLLNQPNGAALEGAQSNGLLTITPQPANYAQPVTLSLTVSAPPGSGLPTPSGSVSFNVDGTLIGNTALASGKTSYVYSVVLPPGTHTFVATYNGDQTFSPASFSALLLVQDPVYTTQTVLVASPLSVLTSQTVRLTATVTSPAPVQNGIVTFMDGSATLGAQVVDPNGVALLDTSTLAAGTHSIKAIYQGYQSFIGVLEVFTPSTSAVAIVTVSNTATVTTLTSSNPSPMAGTVVTFTASVKTSSGVPFGGVTFYDGVSVLGTSSLQSNGSAMFSTASLEVGSHSITATFDANATFAGSTSPAQNVSVTGPGANTVSTVVSLALDNTSTAGGTFLVARVGGLDTASSGWITFLDGGTILGTAPTNALSTATLSLPQLVSGSHSFTASFAGTLHLAPSVSPLLYEQWPASGAGFSLQVATPSVNLDASGPTTIAIGVLATADFQAAVALSCENGLPAGYRCTFSPKSLQGGGTSLMQIARDPIASSRPVSVLPLSGLMFGLFAVCFTRGMSGRRILRLLLMLGIAVTIGCGNPSSQNQRTDMRVLTIQANSQSGTAAVLHSVQIILQVPAIE